MRRSAGSLGSRPPVVVGRDVLRFGRRVGTNSAALLTLLLPASAAILGLLTGILSPWLTPSDAIFRSLVLITLSSTLAYLLVERRLLERVAGHTSVVRGPFFEPAQVHLAAAEVLRSAQPSEAADRSILISTLPSHSGSKVGTLDFQRDAPASLAVFWASFRDKLLAQPAWVVRHLVNVTSAEELDSLLRFFDDMKCAPSYEVKAYSTRSSLPLLAPLVVANRHAFLAAEHARESRLETALHLDDRTIASWASRYFDDLWGGAPFQIRARTGVDAQGIARLRRAVNRHETKRARRS